MKTFHKIVQSAINSPWLYDNYTDIKQEYYRHVSMLLNGVLKRSSFRVKLKIIE